MIASPMRGSPAGNRVRRTDSEKLNRPDKNKEPIMADSEIMAAEVAEPRDAEGCFSLGMMYSSGAGVAVDLIEAHKWFNIAAMRGQSEAAAMRREIAEQMQDVEIGRAQRAARDWLKTHPQPQPALAQIRAAA
jgi:TPR repeat protein